MNRLFISRFSAPFGELSLIHDGGTLMQVHFSAIAADDRLTETTLPEWLSAPLSRYFEGDIAALENIPLHMDGTPFQKSVWTALRRIPAGQTWSYAELASQTGNAKACRAVGSANGRNPCGLVVPCHRVIAADGSLGGFSGGLDVKRWLLRHEGAAFRE
ncbi:MAG: methylated-DNA--[protein]-cysteine S-methyltransferase [Fluviicoccus sp.]|uniref:methylated-DNA--[protein]-cysteine S-methyltransferase n=1 Tax=Fluviicoccus sp. TaxID=2003552 RepID=UPI0027167126|nr:methylated-DNA--[protein]-cysteine S-methyltransferase [Fluviicoccus sp.]MDO8330267.1 methylated-DNA--[protein]-cysteine S-methyltransferase [Fluviicoccus sp.]